LGDCKFCGKPVGFLRSAHAECEKQNQQRQRLAEHGRQQILVEVIKSIESAEPFETLDKNIAEIEGTYSIPVSDRKSILLAGWESAVSRALADGILTEQEEERLVIFKERFALTQNELDRNGALTKTAKAAVLRELLNGKIPQRMNFTGIPPINLQKGEQIVWAFSKTEYFQDKTRRQYVGSSRGVSVRVMRGVYLRTGEFKGHSVEHTERVHVDTGWFFVTNKNVYFAGPRASVRVPYAKIVSFQPFSDGVGIMRDAATAKLQAFNTGDGWFTFNLVTNLAQL